MEFVCLFGGSGAGWGHNATYQGCMIVGKINPDIVAKIESEDATARAQAFDAFSRA
jgi:hypothetical protein